MIFERNKTKHYKIIAHLGGVLSRKEGQVGKA